MILYIIRHGYPVYAPEEKLTELGHKQAKALVPRLKDVGLTAIYSSPLRRARETAEPISETLGLPIQIEPWMSEDLSWKRFTRPADNEFGDAWVWDTEDPAEFLRGENRDAGDKCFELEAMQRAPHAEEGFRQLMADSDRFMARQGYVRHGNEYLIETPSDAKIACFCHQGFGLTWLSHLLRIPPNIFWCEFDLTHTGVTVLEFKNYACGKTIPKCLVLSDMSHLFADPECDMRYHHEFLL